MTDPYYDLFISHAEADRAWVEGYLLDALDRAGVRHHRETAFALGVPRIVEFEKAVKDSRRILLVLSPAYFANDTAQFVDLLAQTFGLETSTWPVIPLVLEPASLPTRLSMLTKLEATNPEDREEALRKLCVLFQRPLPAPPARPLCPYPGMRPFALDRDGQPTYPFFGRDRETDRLLQALRKNRFLTVIGSSGSGKSSLVLAGLIPRLRASGLFGLGGWRIIVMRPTDEPLAELRKALDADPADPAAAAAHALAAQPDARRLLLVIDQFEELFTVARGNTRAFQQALVRLAEVPDTHVVLTVRADFYDELMASPLWPAVQRNREEIAPLDEAGLREAIHKPAEAVGVYVESALVERLAADAAGSPGVLPLVQETLVLLWEKLERRVLPLRSYESLILTRSAYTIPDGEGYRTGLNVAIAQHAESVIASFAGTPRAEIARRIFLRLIQFGEGRPNTRRQQTVAQLRAGHDSVEFAQALKHLTDNRLLTQSGDEQTGRRKADVAHEALIVGWPQLRGWITEHRAAEEIRRELEAKASAWIAKGRGDAGLLDRVDLPAADQWLAGPDGRDIADADPIRDLVRASHQAIEAAERRREEVRQRELDNARKLATEEKLRVRLFRRWAIAMGVAMVLMAGALVWAVKSTRRANLNESLAKSSEEKAKKSEIEAKKQAEEALAQKNAADEAKQAAEKQAKIATSRQLAALSASERNKKWDRSLILAVEALRAENTFEARESLFKALQDRPGLTSFLRIEEGYVTSVAFSPDGKTLAAGYAGGVVLWDAAGRKRLAGEPLAVKEGTVSSVAFSPDGKTLAAGYAVAAGGGVVLWDAAGRERLAGEPLAAKEGYVRSVAFSPDGKTLAAGYAGRIGGGGVVLWDAAGRERLAGEPFAVKEGYVTSLAFSPDGKTLAAGYGNVGDGNGVVLWDAAGRTRLAGEPLAVKAGEVSSVAFSPDGKTLAAGYAVAGGGGGVVLWYPVGRGRLAGEPLAVKEGTVSSVAFSPDGKTLAAGYGGVGGARVGGVVLWYAVGRKRLAGEPLAVTEGAVTSVAFSPDGKTLAAGYAGRIGGGGVVLRDAAGRTRLAGEPLAVTEGDVSSVAFSPDGKTLAAGYAGRIGGGGVVLWDAAGRERLAGEPLAVKEGYVRSVAFSPDGKTLAAGYAVAGGGGGGGVVLWYPVGRGRLAGEPLAVKKGTVSSVAFSPDGKTLAAGYGVGGVFGGGVVLWDAAGRGRLADEPLAVKEEVSSVAFSPDGKTLAAGYGYGVGGGVVLWDAAGRGRLADEPLAVKEGAVSRSLSV